FAKRAVRGFEIRRAPVDARFERVGRLAQRVLALRAFGDLSAKSLVRGNQLGRALFDPALERVARSANLRLHLLPLGDVGHGAEHADESTLAIAQRARGHHRPKLGAVRSPQADVALLDAVAALSKMLGELRAVAFEDELVERAPLKIRRRQP